MSIRPTLLLVSVALLGASISASPGAAQGAQGPWTVASPEGRVTVTLREDAASGLLTYAVSLRRADGRTVEVIAPSPLGAIRDDASFARGLRVVDRSTRAVDERYTLIHGKTSAAHATANELTLSLADGAGRRMDVVARAYPEGAALRYRFPGRDTASHTMRMELTGFRLPAGTKGWMLPHDQAGRYTPAYENLYREVEAGAFSPTGVGWDFPATFRTPDGAWVLLTESGLDRSYAGSHLAWDPMQGLYRLRFPEGGEGMGVGDVLPSSPLPWETPWRVIEVGDRPGDLVESALVTHLAPPPAAGDWSWVEPGRASWSWWSASDSPRDPAALRRFYDLAAEMGWEYSLIDANWNLMPDDTLRALVDYGKAKGVATLLWYNSGGPHNVVTEQPRDRLLDPQTRRAELARLASMGVRGVKVDFWQSDKQDRVRQYLDLFEDAAARHLVVDTHGSTIPRGWQRTWPNLVSMEAVHGAESYKFDPSYPEVAPSRNVMLVFTRNAIGPMDYTPVTLSDVDHPHLTTNAHELGLAVAFESGIQHFADRPEAYRGLPPAAVGLLEAVPAAWDETRLLAGDPSSYAVVARRKGREWWIGTISGEAAPRRLAVDLSFLPAGRYELTLVGDGDGPRALRTETRAVRASDHLTEALLPRGGFLARLRPAGRR